ncbi:MAG TPA: hypothetical protein VF868_04940 [Bacteroidia bacterium]|jgi:lipopolysaccharide export LptBFGC system permease protein LptF
MKTTIPALLTMSLLTALSFLACNSSADKVNSAKENVAEAEVSLQDAKNDYDSEYEKFKLESNDKITANEQIIADLKIYSKDKKKEVKDQYEATINSLEQKNQQMKNKVSEYKKDSSNSWESFKREFNHDMDELGKALSDLGTNNSK